MAAHFGRSMRPLFLVHCHRVIARNGGKRRVVVKGGVVSMCVVCLCVDVCVCRRGWVLGGHLIIFAMAALSEGW